MGAKSHSSLIPVTCFVVVNYKITVYQRNIPPNLKFVMPYNNYILPSKPLVCICKPLGCETSEMSKKNSKTRRTFQSALFPASCKNLANCGQNQTKQFHSICTYIVQRPRNVIQPTETLKDKRCWRARVGRFFNESLSPLSILHSYRIFSFL